MATRLLRRRCARATTAPCPENLTSNAVWVWLFTSYDYAVPGHGVSGFSFLPSLTDSLSTLSGTSVS